jgi:hypothetical protein
MSKRNGDRARFQKDRKRKVRHRQRVRELLKRDANNVRPEVPIVRPSS